MRQTQQVQKPKPKAKGYTYTGRQGRMTNPVYPNSIFILLNISLSNSTKLNWIIQISKRCSTNLRKINIRKCSPSLIDKEKDSLRKKIFHSSQDLQDSQLQHSKSERSLNSQIKNLKDRKGVLDYKKYLTAIYIVRDRKPDQNEIYQSLCVFDKENTGFIEVQQLKQILMQIGDIVSSNEFDAVFSELEVSQDGRVLIEDVVKLFTLIPQY